MRDVIFFEDDKHLEKREQDSKSSDKKKEEVKERDKDLKDELCGLRLGSLAASFRPLVLTKLRVTQWRTPSRYRR